MNALLNSNRSLHAEWLIERKTMELFSFGLKFVVYGSSHVAAIEGNYGRIDVLSVQKGTSLDRTMVAHQVEIAYAQNYLPGHRRNL